MNDTPIIGAKVISADGEELGCVMEIDADCLRIDAFLAPDYWVGPDVIEKTSPATVHLVLTRNDLGKAQQAGLIHLGRHSHRET
jgi:hypothetical protein